MLNRHEVEILLKAGAGVPPCAPLSALRKKLRWFMSMMPTSGHERLISAVIDGCLPSRPHLKNGQS